MTKTQTVNLETIKEIVNKLVDFVKPTYGPLAHKVILNDGFSHRVLDDGVAIANDFKLDDPIEDSIIQVIKEVSQKTNDRVGDGTTGSLIMLQAIMNQLNDSDSAKDLNTALEEAIQTLRIQAKPSTTTDELQQVAQMAYDNTELASIIANLVHDLGPEGVINIEESQNLQTKSEIIEGLGIDQGFVSPYMVTDPERMKAIYENVPVLVTNKTIKHNHEIIPVLEKLIGIGKTDLVIVADDIEGEALRTIVLNKIQGRFNVLGIKAPGFGERKKEYLKDISVVTGAQFIDTATGILLEETSIDQLGGAKKVIATRDTTTFVGGEGKKEAIDLRITQLQGEVEAMTYSFDKAMIKERISKLQHGVGVIKVGASTEAEMKAIKYKVEDAVNATKLALKSGVVEGAGQSLRNIQTSSEILNAALKAPEAVLLANGTVLDKPIYDPLEVLIASLESAVSIALLLTSVTGVIVKTND